MGHISLLNNSDPIMVPVVCKEVSTDYKSSVSDTQVSSNTMEELNGDTSEVFQYMVLDSQDIVIPIEDNGNYI